MDQNLQPGRIEPKRMPGSIPGATTSDRPPMALTSFVGKIGGNKIMGTTASNEAQDRHQKALSQALKSGKYPKEPEYRISSFEGGVLIAITLVVDVVEFILGLLAETGIGEILAIIVSVVFAFALGAYCLYRIKLTFLPHWKIYGSIFGSSIAEGIPGLNACAFWTLDAWWIIRTTRTEDRETHARLMEDLEKKRAEDERAKWVQKYQQQQMEQQEEDEADEEQNLRMAA